MIRRINFLGGPGSRKSKIAAKVYGLMRDQIDDEKWHLPGIELVREYIKDWTFEDRKVLGFDQIYTFAKQLRREEIVLRDPKTKDHGIIITDSPLDLSWIYAARYGPFDCSEQLFQIAQNFNKRYSSLNIFLERGDAKYSEIGRYQTEEDAVYMDRFIEKCLVQSNIPFIKMSNANHEPIVELIWEKLFEPAV